MYQASSPTTSYGTRYWLQEKKTVRNTNTWILNNTFLNNQHVTEEIKREIKENSRKKWQWKHDYSKPIKSESESEATQSCPTLCDHMDCSLPGFSVHGIFQARILEWVAISFCRESSRPGDWTRVSCTVGKCQNLWDAAKAVLRAMFIATQSYPRD